MATAVRRSRGGKVEATPPKVAPTIPAPPPEPAVLSEVIDRAALVHKLADDRRDHDRLMQRAREQHLADGEHAEANARAVVGYIDRLIEYLGGEGD